MVTKLNSSLHFNDCLEKQVEADLIIVVFWPPHSGHALNVEPDKVVEGGAGVEDDPEESHLVLLQLLLFESARITLVLLLWMSNDCYDEEGRTEHDVEDGEREDPVVEPLTHHIVLREDDSEAEEAVGDDDEGGENCA